MPRLDGLGATRRLRAGGYDAARLPIVALTANAFADDIAECCAAGMQDHLAKPMRMSDLVAVLQRWAGSTGSEPAEYEQETNPELIRMFAERKALTFQAIDEALGGNDLGEEKRLELAALLHQIAGIAAFFGEVELGEATSQVEQALKDAAAPQDAAQLLEELQLRIAV